MTTDDERIGQNVATLRGDRSQKSIAEAMQEAGGHKWSQATVWSVEKGQRPLRLTEAIDLARILGRPVAALFADPEQTKGDEFAEGIIQAVAKYYGDIVTKAMSLYEARERFDALKASLEEGELSLSRRVMEKLERVDYMTPEIAIQDAVHALQDMQQKEAMGDDGVDPEA